MKKLGYVEPASYFPKTSTKKATKTQNKPASKKPAKKK